MMGFLEKIKEVYPDLNFTRLEYSEYDGGVHTGKLYYGNTVTAIFTVDCSNNRVRIEIYLETDETK